MGSSKQYPDASQPRPAIGGLRVVVIGGGTGLSTLLRGLKWYVNPSADRRVATSGKPEISALSEDEALLSRLFQHRFAQGSGLQGHSFGNLFLAALTSITKDFSEAVRLSSEILVTRGHIYPVTTANVELEALMEDGTRVRGETKITASKGRIKELFLIPDDVEPLPQTLEAIARADLITIGPGSLFT